MSKGISPLLVYIAAVSSTLVSELGSTDRGLLSPPF